MRYITCQQLRPSIINVGKYILVICRMSLDNWEQLGVKSILFLLLASVCLFNKTVIYGL